MTAPGSDSVTTPVVHIITLKSISPTRWRAVCSCGRYQSSGFAYPGSAEAAGASHVRAKGGYPG